VLDALVGVIREHGAGLVVVDGLGSAGPVIGRDRPEGFDPGDLVRGLQARAASTAAPWCCSPSAARPRRPPPTSTGC
jgi:hypothetical protein